MNKVPNLTEHTHTNSSSKNDGFQSKDDKVILDALSSQKPAYDALIDQTGEPTGFSNNANITVTYNPTTRKVTLTGTFKAYFKGVQIRELIDGWTSEAHADVQATYYLYYCNGWHFDTTPWTFACLQVAFVQYNSHQIGIREVHGFMPNSVHEELHKVIGSYKNSGGDFSSYVLSSTTAANRRPDVSNTVVADEDLLSTVLALTTKSYTQRYLTGSAVRSFNTAQAEIVPVNGSQPYWNENVGGTWQQTLFSNNSYGAVFVVAVPTTNDAGSQVYRYMWVQPQQNSASLAYIQSLTTNSLVNGDSALLVSEFVFIGKIIIHYTGGNWTIVSVEKLDGTRVASVATAVGGLTVVSHDTTLTGDGTSTSLLGVVDNYVRRKDILITDFDTLNPASYDTGTHSVYTNAAPSNKPSGTGNYLIGTLYINNVSQKYSTLVITDNSTGYIYRRLYNGTSWGSWVKIWDGTSLVSGTDIKTVNSTSLIGSGDVAVQPTLVSGTNIKTVNGLTLLGSGNVVITENGNTGSVYWTKLQDGTMYVYASASASLACSTAMGAGGGYRTAQQTLSLPQSFVDTNYKVVVSPDTAYFNIGGGGRANDASSLYWFLTSVSSDATARTRVAQIIAIGRWK